MECCICYNVSDSFLKCSECKSATCIDCILNYKKLNCPMIDCLKDYEDLEIKPHLNNKDVSNLYILHYIYKNYVFEDSHNNIYNYFRKIEQKKTLRFGYIEEKKNEVFSLCPKEGCKGSLNDKNGECDSCKFIICLNCEEKKHDGECSETKLKEIQFIRKTCQKCPFCYNYIFRDEGCPHMRCTNCGASFDWDKPGQLVKTQYKHNTTTINNKMREKYLQRYKELFSKKDRQKKKNLFVFRLDINIPEHIVIWGNNLKSQYSIICNNVEKHSVLYLQRIRELIKENKHKELTQIEVSYLIPDKEITDFYNVLKRQEYYLKINEKFKTIIEWNNSVLEEMFTSLENDFIFPQKICFRIKDKDTALVEKDIGKEKKIKSLYTYTKNGEDLKEIELLDYDQEIHAESIYNILKEKRVCLNTSHAGSGKTYISLYVTNALNLENIIVFCPKIMKDKWEEVILKYNNAYKLNFMIFTYSEITSPSFTKNNNIYTTTTQRYKTTVNLSKEFQKLLHEKTIIVYDEIHNLKSTSSNGFKLLEEISKYCYINKSYILGLSATPVEKEKDIEIISKKLTIFKKYKKIPMSQDPLIKFNKKKQTSWDVIEENNISDDENYPTFEKLDEVHLFEMMESLNEPSTSKDEPSNDEPFNDEPSTSKDEPSTSKNKSSKGKKKLEKKIIFSISDFVSEEIIRNIKSELKAIDFENLERNVYLRSLKIRPISAYNYNLINIIKNLIVAKIDFNNVKNMLFTDKTEMIYLNAFNRERQILDEDLKKVLEYIDSLKYIEFYIIASCILLESISDFMLCKMPLNFNKKEIGGSNKTGYVPLILFLYGFDPFDSVLLFNIKNLEKHLKYIIFNKTSFNILKALDKTEEVEISQLRMLEFDLSPSDTNSINLAFTRTDSKTGRELSELEKLALITKGLIVSESIYIKYLIEIITGLIKYDYKIALGFHFKETMQDFKTYFDNIKIPYLYIDGTVKDKTKIVDLYQTDNKYKLIFINMKSANCGIDLDDKEGNKKRIVFIIPDFKFSETVQFMYRFKRTDSKSEPIVFLVKNHMWIIEKILNKNLLNLSLVTSLPNLSNLPVIKNKDVVSSIIN